MVLFGLILFVILWFTCGALAAYICTKAPRDSEMALDNKVAVYVVLWLGWISLICTLAWAVWMLTSKGFNLFVDHILTIARNHRSRE